MKQNVQLEMLVSAVLAQVSHQYSVYQIQSHQQLEDIGIVREVDLATVKSLLYRIVSGKQSPSFRHFIDSLSIGPSSSVTDVATQLSQAISHESGTDYSSGLDAPTAPVNAVETVVKMVLSEKARHHSFGEIKLEQGVTNDLDLDDLALEEAKTGIYETLTGSNPSISLSEFSRLSEIHSNTTVKRVVRSVMAALPGNDPTVPNG